MQYAQDYDERNPVHCRAGFPAGSPGDDYSWATQVMPYAKNDQMFLCPSVSWMNRTRLCGGYGYNMDKCDWVSMGTVLYPASTIIISETVNNKWIGDWPTIDQVVTGLASRHNEGANNVFVDGHAKWMSYQVLASPSNYTIYWTGATAQ